MREEVLDVQENLRKATHSWIGTDTQKPESLDFLDNLSEGYTTLKTEPIKPKASHKSNVIPFEQIKRGTEAKGIQKEQSNNENPYVPFIEDIAKEVGKLPLKKRKAFGKHLSKVAMTVLPLVGVTSFLSRNSAEATGIDQLLPYLHQRGQTGIPQTPVTGQTTPSGEMIPVDGNIIDKMTQVGILPVEIIDMLVNIVITCGILGVLLAMICLIIAGGFRMIGQLERAKKWSVDVIKGLGQIMLAPLIIFLLVMITNYILGGIDGLDLFY